MLSRIMSLLGGVACVMVIAVIATVFSFFAVLSAVAVSADIIVDNAISSIYGFFGAIYITLVVIGTVVLFLINARLNR